MRTFFMWLGKTLTIFVGVVVAVALGVAVVVAVLLCGEVIVEWIYGLTGWHKPAIGIVLLLSVLTLIVSGLTAADLLPDDGTGPR